MIDELVEEFYQVKNELRLLGYYSNIKTNRLADRKHELIWEIKKALDKVSKRNGDKIRTRLWEELGVVI